ncbi:copper resistance protein B [Variovorax dokdonensis]|uniref:Copper resistance protein B n=1 Tax=Variovorax dokdonensis TaxID=344883 RepID=A0ABT7N752_9BURK|nr:copper resistance protein B [Variovorax dokdonensis]MDM0043762.1 copper resistance protein B [Variovorax dokdonensis]
MFAVNARAQGVTPKDHRAHYGATAAQPQAPAAPAATVPHDGHEAASASSAAPAPAPAMEHGDMKMQGGSAPVDARDPHAYSNGLKLGEGDYAVPGVPRLMLADEHHFGALLGETLEQRFARKGEDSMGYDLQGWYGTTYNRVVVKAEGDVADGKLEESRTELLWGHAIASYWDAQLGVRLDNGEGPSRQWLAFGIQGLAPYWFELDATAYVSNGGRTALRLEASYELLITQRLILEPKIEMQFYGSDDPERRIGSGLAEASAGLRLRYEISRQFAPYAGIERAGSFGTTADYVRADGGRAQQTRFVAGVRFWF